MKVNRLKKIFGVIQVHFEWTGRSDKSDNSKRFHQVVKRLEIDQLKQMKERQFGFIGFACDEGVRRNKGRVGAANGPDDLRKYLANISYHLKERTIVDIGNVYCVDGDLETAQGRLGNGVAQLIEHNYIPIILGGGHETFYGHYLGARKALGKDQRIGMINLDAHFDLRKDTRPSSGTMFRQVLEEDPNASYLCLGLQSLGNTAQLFATAEELGVQYILEKDMADLEASFALIDQFAADHDSIIYTICSDVLDQAAAPGVSAPSPFGLSPKKVREITQYVVRQPNFRSMDVSEVNPSLDPSGNTSRLMSYIIAEAMQHMK